jgi:hypothetical protein
VEEPWHTNGRVNSLGAVPDSHAGGPGPGWLVRRLAVPSEEI